MLITAVFGQQQQKYRWEVDALAHISLSLPFANAISVSTAKTNFVEVVYTTEGEYQKETLLSHFVDKKTVRLKEQLNPVFTPFKDKLSAHKVMATTLEISYPEQSSLSLTAGTAKIVLEGLFPKFNIQLEEG